jgi:WD40 repeat protein
MSADDSALHGEPRPLSGEAGQPPDPEEFCRTRPAGGPEPRRETDVLVSQPGGDLPPVSQGGRPGLPAASKADIALGDFRLLRELGRGGMGVVYEAEQISLKRRVALKVLSPHLSLSAEQVQKFRREAEAGGRQRHPGIVSIYAVGEHDGAHFIAQELVEGGVTLADRLKQFRDSGDLPREHFRRMAALFADVAEALAHAHANGVIHCDIKPSNILLTEAGSPKVGDFGLARVENALALTRTGEFEGTPYYVSPEQVSRPRGIDHRTDIFSLGVTLYEALTLACPFQGETSLEVLKQVLNAEPLDPRRLSPRVPRDLAVICLHALEKEPQARYASMGEFAADLRRWLAGEAILARPAGTVTRVLKWTRRRRGIMAAAVSSVAIALALLGVLFYQQVQENRTFRVLLDQAGEAAAGEHWEEAIDFIVQARSLKPGDRVAQEMHRLYMQQKELAAIKSERDAKEAALLRSEGLRLVAESEKLFEHNPGLALLLALDAAKRLPGLVATNAVCEALSVCRERLTLAIRRYSFLPELQQADRQWPRSVKFSPDGRKLLTTAWDPAPAIWDAVSGERLLVLGEEPEAQRGEAGPEPAGSENPDGFHMARLGVFSSDGRKVALTDSNREACIVDVESGARTPRLGVAGSWGFQIEFSPDGRQVAAVCPVDSTTRAWDANTGSELYVLRYASRPNAIAFSPDSRILAVAAGDRTVRIYDAQSGVELRALRDGEIGSRTLRFSPDGALLASADDGGMILWEVATGRRAAVIRGPWDSLISVWGIEFSPDGSLVTTTWGDPVARVWHVHDGSEALQLRGHTDVIRAIDFSPDGTRIVTASFDHTARIWDAETGEALAVLLGHENGLHEAWFSPDGRTVATISEDETARIWDAETGPRRDVCDTGDMHALFFDKGTVTARDGRKLEIPERYGGVKLFNPSSAASGQTFTLSPSRELMGARFSPDEALVITGSRQQEDGWVEIWDARTGALIKELLVSRAGATQGACLLDGNRILMTTATEGVLRVWDWRNAQEQLSFRGHGVRTAAYSPDRERLVTSGSDGTVRTWNARTGEPLVVMRGHTGDVESAVVSPDGRRVVSHSKDDTVRLWDMESGEELLTIRGVAGNATSRVGFSPEGQNIVAVGRDGTTRSWPVDVIAAAERRKPRELTPAEKEAYAVWAAGEEEALALVQRLFDERILARDVIAEIEADRSLDETVRQAALRFARVQEDNAVMLEAGARSLLEKPRTPATEARAARLRDAAARLRAGESAAAR